MGLLIPLLETDSGLQISNAYVGLMKFHPCGIHVTESDDGTEVLITSHYRVFATKDARDQNKPMVLADILQFSVPKASFSNLFQHIYDVLKQKYPEAVDEL